MSNYNNITARWDRGTLSEAIISRQFDDAATLVAFAGVPTGDDDEDAVYHLIVWMATEEGGEPHEQAPILLDAPEWLISNFYTQFTQVIRFQLCIQTEGGAYEAHSPIFSGRIARSLRHDGTTDDINTSVLFDPYKKYVDEKAMAAGAVVIDADLDEDSENPVQNKIVAGAITGLNGRLEQLEQGGTGADVPSEVRQAIYTLLTKGLYSDTGLTDEKAVLQSWATEVTDITIGQSSISISGSATSQLSAVTTPAGGLVTWSSSNPAVATVSSTGLVTGVSTGTATITASAGGKSATCAVTVSGVTTNRTITNTLSHCANSNASVSVTNGDSYTGTITADTGYTMDDTDITVTMGGTDITSTALSQGVITIASVTGDVVITATATDSLYPLKNGTFTFSNGVSVTVTGHNHVSVVIPDGNSSDGYIDFSDISENTSTFATTANVQNHTAKFTIPSGSAVVYSIKNLTNTDNQACSFNAYGTGTSNISLAISNVRTGDNSATKTFNADTACGCLFMACRFPGTYTFDVSLTVGDSKYV